MRVREDVRTGTDSEGRVICQTEDGYEYMPVWTDEDIAQAKALAEEWGDLFLSETAEE